jgi:FtsP/CotA-like multicopper oxidase with cupredoxin domain
VVLLAHTVAAYAQRRPQIVPLAPATEWVGCLPVGQPLVRIPEFVSNGGILSGTIVLEDIQQQRLAFRSGPINKCAPQRVRYFRGVNAVLPGYAGAIPPGYGGVPPIPPNQDGDPLPGPTLRARVGDIVQLTFLNQVDPNHYGDSIDRGERGQGCDETRGQYPGLDQYPDCFHGSSTGNIHFHGTHTNPSSTGDNVFIEVRPSPRHNEQPIITQDTFKSAFEGFFALCQIRLGNDVLSQWPRSWNDLPKPYTSAQEGFLKAYDSNPAIVNKLWPVDQAQLRAGAWPQYYVGAVPYCFRLPRYAAAMQTQVAHPPALGHNMPGMTAGDQGRALMMGQSPGTHWYHAHKHGSTTINVANGMTGAFIIEGGYDDAFNQFYGMGWTGPQSWTRSQPVLVLNQLGVSPNLERSGGGGPHQDISVNGRLQPKLTMRPGEVQLWRIANTSSRSGVFIVGFNPPATASQIAWGPVQWKQTAQDGVQFAGTNYQNSTNPQLLIAPGNRVDLLVKAPSVLTPSDQPYTLMIQQARSRCETLPKADVPTIPTSPPSPICSPELPAPLLTVEIAGPAATGNQTQFIPPAQLQASFPSFLNDIPASDVKASKTVVFDSNPTNGTPGAMHTIDGHKFDGNVGQVVMLNTVEEWKIVNRTVNGGIQPPNPPTTPNPTIVTTDPPGVVDHPFHIHINPFQIVEFFDPNEVLPGTATAKYIFEGKAQTGQCLLDITNPETWKPCGNGPQINLVWWDVFPIPSARAVFAGVGTTNPTMTLVPGYFKMRSRFVDYSGQYVIHCHILAHEDRGMMTIVEVVPFTTAYSHK